MSVWSIVGAILVLALCILVHELGHFLSALALGIPVEEFSIGFGPKLLQFRFRGIKYSLRLVFLGGYVRYYMDESDMVGREDGRGNDEADTAQYADEADGQDIAVDGDAGSGGAHAMSGSLQPDGTYGAADDGHAMDENELIERVHEPGYLDQPAWRRMVSAFCGPFMNVVMAFIAAVALYTMLGNPIVAPRVTEYATDSAAYKAGMQLGDVVVAVNDVPVSYDEAGLQVIMSEIAGSNGEALKFDVERGGERMQLSVTPMYSQADGRYMIGASFGDRTPCSPWEAMSRAGSYMVNVTSEMYRSLGDLFTSDVPIDQQLTGPVGTVQIISEQVQRGGVDALNIIMLISLNFGIFNLLPIPGLDGSKMLFLLIEMIRRKPIPPNKEAMVNLIGLALLFGLMIFITYKDIARLIGG